MKPNSQHVMEWMREHPEARQNHAFKYRRSTRGRFAFLKSDANRRKLEMTLTIEEFGVLREQPCEYCGSALADTGGGLDRKDNAIGYILGNVVPCCHSCNVFKGDRLSYEEMKAVMQLLKTMRSGV